MKFKKSIMRDNHDWWVNDIKLGSFVRVPSSLDTNSYYIWKALIVVQHPNFIIDNEMPRLTYMQIISANILGAAFPDRITLQLKSLTESGKILEFRILKGHHYDNFLRAYQNSLLSQ